MSLTYSQWVTEVSTLMAVQSSDANFTLILPGCIDYAEQRIYRELDLLQTVVRDSSNALTPNSRNFVLPTTQGIFVTLTGINVITPAGTTSPDSGTRNPLTPVSREFLDFSWPDSSTAAQPTKFAPLTQSQILVGPWADAAYTIEVVGTQRPTPLSSGNTTTFLSQYLPDLFVAASMVFMSGYLKNFGSQSDQPQMAQSWESQYQTLFSSANSEEMRKKFAGSAWSSLSVGGSQAQPQRS